MMVKRKKLLISFLLIVFCFVSFADIFACNDCQMAPQGNQGEHLCSVCLNPIGAVNAFHYNNISIPTKLDLASIHFSFLEPTSSIDKPPQN